MTCPASSARLVEAVGALPGREDVRVLDWMELAPGMMAAIRFDLAFWFVFYVILAVVVAFTILNTFLMAVFERTREFGVMMALGSTPARLTGLLFRESAILAILGGLAGFLLGFLVTDWFHERGIFLPGMTEWAKYHGLPNRIYPIQTASGILLGIGLVLLISMAAAAIPIGRVRRLTPVRAMQGGRRG